MQLLDPGAGVGSLTAAAVSEMLSREEPPEQIEVVAYEIDSLLAPFLARPLDLWQVTCAAAGIAFTARVEVTDFLAGAAQEYLQGRQSFNCAILNPPYRKIRSSSGERQTCRAMGLEVSNLYAAFVGATALLLEEGGEMVAITPRSFANGPYFRAFRNFLLGKVAFRRIHVFDSRAHAFREDDVLQENLIMSVERVRVRPESVELTASATPDDPVRSRTVPWGRVASR